ncbi:hypothetical protein T484DRAFT_1906233 [Baffinella frigidus]|nr:hypothetical protein T484DRAFT_1906233 [Cryptophyta sp. CCMP2293]
MVPKRVLLGAGVGVGAVLLLCVALQQQRAPVALLWAKTSHSMTDHWGVNSAATRAVDKLERSVKKMRYLDNPAAAAVSEEMAKAISTVRTLGPASPKVVQTAKVHRGRHVNYATLAHPTVAAPSGPSAKHMAAARVATKLAGKKIDHASAVAEAKGLAKELTDEDSQTMTSELSKLVDTADSLNEEMRKLKREHRLQGTGEVQRRAKAVAEVGKRVQAAAGMLVMNKQQVVAHELEVADAKLQQARVAEGEAREASAEAGRAEQLAAEKRAEAASDEEVARVRRASARRARAIAAKGSISKIKAAMAAEEKKEEAIARRLTAEEVAARGAREAAAAKERAAARKPVKEPVAKDTSPEEIQGCTDEIAQLGCLSLPFGSKCAKFCGAEGVAAEKRVLADGGMPGAQGGGVKARSYSVHHRTGFFVGDTGKDTYLDSVFGNALQTSQATLQAGKDFLVQPGGDISSNGHDLGEVQSSEGLDQEGKVLHREQAMAQRLQDALAQTKIENVKLRSTVKSQAHLVHHLATSVSFVNDGADEGTVESDATPPLPAYKASTQDLNEVPAGHRRSAVLVHNLDSVNRGFQASYDPMRP